jgi:hypothetical protein
MVGVTSEHEREADTTADAVLTPSPIQWLKPLHPGSVSRQELQPDEAIPIEHTFDLDPNLFIKWMDAPAVREREVCEEFPGGTTACELDETTGTLTGKVKQEIRETNPCTRPCVERHEAVHVQQLKRLCPQIRDCQLAADKGERDLAECNKMAAAGAGERECPAHKVSIPRLKERLNYAKACQSEENKNYGTRYLQGDECRFDLYACAP